MLRRTFLLAALLLPSFYPQTVRASSGVLAPPAPLWTARGQVVAVTVWSAARLGAAVRAEVAVDLPLGGGGRLVTVPFRCAVPSSCADPAAWLGGCKLFDKAEWDAAGFWRVAYRCDDGSAGRCVEVGWGAARMGAGGRVADLAGCP